MQPEHAQLLAARGHRLQAGAAGDDRGPADWDVHPRPRLRWVVVVGALLIGGLAVAGPTAVVTAVAGLGVGRWLARRG
jgi:hypothetical protein